LNKLNKTWHNFILTIAGNIHEWIRFLYSNIIKQPADMAKMAVPAIIYMIQNNLLFVGVSNLPAATFQVSALCLNSTKCLVLARLVRNLEFCKGLNCLM